MVYVDGSQVKRWFGGNMFAIGIGVILCIGVVWLGRIPATDDPIQTIIFTVFMFLLSLMFFLNGFRVWKKERLVRDTPTSTVRSMAMGPVEVKGRAKVKRSSTGSVLSAPFSGEDCLLYKYKVEEYRRRGKHGYDWVTVDSGHEGVPFAVEDETGRVTVDPTGAELKMPEDNRYTVGAGDEPPKQIQSFLSSTDAVSEQGSLDLGLFEMPVGNRQRFTERYVTPGEHVYVYGEAMERDNRRSSRNQENIVINQVETTPMFVISDKSEKELLSSLSSSALFQTIGGAVMGIGSFWFLVWFVGLL